jgi:hypothetical protein
MIVGPIPNRNIRQPPARSQTVAHIEPENRNSAVARAWTTRCAPAAELSSRAGCLTADSDEIGEEFDDCLLAPSWNRFNAHNNLLSSRAVTRFTRDRCHPIKSSLQFVIYVLSLHCESLVPVRIHGLLTDLLRRSVPLTFIESEFVISSEMVIESERCIGRSFLLYPNLLLIW